MTRLTVIELLFGCLNSTLPPAAIEKLCQLISARSVDWLMTVLLPPWLVIVAAPVTTVPPVGSALAALNPSTDKQLVPRSRVRTMAELVLFMTFIRLEAHGQVDEKLGGFLAAPAAR